MSNFLPKLWPVGLSCTAVLLLSATARAENYHLFAHNTAPLRGFVAVCVEIKQAHALMGADIFGIGPLEKGFETDNIMAAVTSLPHRPVAVLVGDQCLAKFIAKVDAVYPDPKLRAKFDIYQAEY